MKLAELQDLVMRLVGERNEWYSRYMSAVSNPDLLPSGEDQPHPADGHMDINSEDSPGITAHSHMCDSVRSDDPIQKLELN